MGGRANRRSGARQIWRAADFVRPIDPNCREFNFSRNKVSRNRALPQADRDGRTYGAHLRLPGADGDFTSLIIFGCPQRQREDVREDVRRERILEEMYSVL